MAGASEAAIDARIDAVLAADPKDALTESENALLLHVDRITKEPWSCTERHVAELRDVGWTDEQIHAAVQVAAYFNYINRIADALGVDLEPEMPPPA